MPNTSSPDQGLPILFVTRKWPPAVGGMETYAVELVEALKLLGYNIDLVALPGRKDGQVPGMGALLAFGAKHFVKLLFAKGPWNAIHGGDLAIWPLIWAASCLAGKNTPLVLSAHGTDISLASQSTLKGRLYRAYLRLGRRLLGSRLTAAANSEATADHLRDAGFRQVMTIPLGCKVTVPATVTETPTQLLFAGRLVARKGLSWFVANVLPKLDEGITLNVAGTEWDASESEALRLPNVDFLGPLPQDALWAKMATALAVVIPNVRSGSHQFEGFGLIAAEAAAAGGLVLASRLDGYTSSVIDGQTGTLLPPEDANAWAEAINKIARMTPEDRAAQKTKAKDAAQQAFAWSRVAEETAQLYSK